MKNIVFTAFLFLSGSSGVVSPHLAMEEEHVLGVQAGHAGLHLLPPPVHAPQHHPVQEANVFSVDEGGEMSDRAELGGLPGHQLLPHPAQNEANQHFSEGSQGELVL